jgi:uncharacterized protein (DUF3820 family)
MFSAWHARKIRAKEQASSEVAEKVIFERRRAIMAERFPEYVDKIIQDLPEQVEIRARDSFLTIFHRDTFLEWCFSKEDIPEPKREELLPMEKIKKFPALARLVKLLRKQGYKLEANRTGSYSETTLDWAITMKW